MQVCLICGYCSIEVAEEESLEHSLSYDVIFLFIYLKNIYKLKRGYFCQQK
jgi:hypothetical protein